MQTKTKPVLPNKDQAPDHAQKSKPNKLILSRLANITLALLGLTFYFLYLTKGASFYSFIPGGRKLLFGGIALLFIALLGVRLYFLSDRRWQQSLFTNVKLKLKLREWVPVGIILAAAIGVRIWGINFGLPYLEQVDEWNVAERAIHEIQTGNFDPLDFRYPPLPDNDRQAFTYPSLYTYLQDAVFSARFLRGVAAGNYDSISNLNSPLVKADFYEWGRGLTAFLGAGTVLLVFLVGKRFYGLRAGTVGALFLCFFYLHALNSHWLTTDVPSGFFALLPFLWIYRIAEGTERRQPYLLAGLFCGLAVGCKYNNLLVLLPLVIAHFSSRPARRKINSNLWLALGAVFLGFFISSPFIFFHLPNFLTDVAAIINHYQNVGHPGFEGTENWRFYIGAMWNDNALVVVFALAGVALAFARHRWRDLIFLSFPLVSYIQLSSYKVNFTRNLMPIVPFLTILGGYALVWLFEKLLQKQNLVKLQVPLIAAVAVLSIISPALTIAQYDRYNSQLTNRARATAWIEQNLPHGSRLWIEPFSVELLPRNRYRVEGGKGVLEHPADWYSANGYNYIVLSEAYYKEALDTAKPAIQEAYRSLINGPRPANLTLAQDFPKNSSDRPGPRVIILSTGLPVVASSLSAYKIDKPLQFNFGEKIKLGGVFIPPAAKAGTSLGLILYWQCLTSPEANLTTFIHLLDSTGKIVTQLDLPPLSGTRPTSEWKAGETLQDEYPLPLPATLVPGSYSLTAGLYLATNGSRLLLSSGGDEADLGQVTVIK